MLQKRKCLVAMILAAACMAAIPQPGQMIQAAETTTVTEKEIAPSGICKGTDGTMYYADSEANAIWIAKGNKIQLAAGKLRKSGLKNGSSTKALFHSPWDIVAYRDGYAISDTENHVIRYLKDGKVITLAGSGKTGAADGKKTKASFARPTGMAVGKNGELYIADTDNNCIRVMDKTGNVSTYAGGKKGCADGSIKKAKFEEPTGLYYYKGALYVADSGNHRICMIKNDKVVTIAGSKKGKEGDKNGAAEVSMLSNPQGVCVYKNNVYIADTGNGSVKKLKGGKVTAFLEAYSLENALLPAAPRALEVKGKTLYIGDIYIQQLIIFDL